MSKKIPMDGLKAIPFDEFKKNEEKTLQNRYDRYYWTVKEWNRIITKKFNRPPHIDALYIEGSIAFFYGCYTVTILSIATAIELTLKAVIDLSELSSKRKRSFKNIINEAVNQKIISASLGNEIHYLRENTRNVLIHDQSIASHMTIGWEKDPKSDAGYMLSEERLNKLIKIQRDSKESLFISREVLAREAIQILFQVFSCCIGKKWINLI